MRGLDMQTCSHNKPAAPNPAIASRLHAGHHWRGVGEPERSAASASWSGTERFGCTYFFAVSAFFAALRLDFQRGGRRGSQRGCC